MNNPNKSDKNVINLEPGTLLLIAVALLLVPLLLTGFVSQ